MRCKRTYVNTLLPLAGGLIKQTTAAADWSVHLQRTDRSQGAFSWLKAATTTFTFKTLFRHYAKRVLTPRSLNEKLGPQRNCHEGWAAIRHYANQPARPL